MLSPFFPSRTHARAWAIACGVPVAAVSVSGSPGRWFSVPGPAKKKSCLLCSRLGSCSKNQGPGCSFQPGPWWPEIQPVQQTLF